MCDATRPSHRCGLKGDYLGNRSREDGGGHRCWRSVSRVAAQMVRALVYDKSDRVGVYNSERRTTRRDW